MDVKVKIEKTKKPGGNVERRNLGENWVRLDSEKKRRKCGRTRKKLKRRKERIVEGLT